MRYTTSATAIAALAAVASAKNWRVEVGDDNEDAFSPSQLSGVAEGDTISFKIYRTHNVIQGAFSSPCQPSSGGFDSGAPYSGGESNPEFFVVTVNSTEPLYAYCGFPGHCQEGMVFAVNAPSSGNTLAAYKSAAEDSDRSSGGDAVSGGVYSSREGGEGGSSSSSGGSSSSSHASSHTSSHTSSRASSASSDTASPTASSSSATSSAGSTSASESATTTTSGSPSGTSGAAASSSSPGGAAGLEANQGLATAAVLGLAGLLSWFM